MTDVFLVKCGRFVINVFLYYCWNGAKRPCDKDICKMAAQEEKRKQCELYCERSETLVQLEQEILANEALQTELATQEQEILLYKVFFFISLGMLVLVVSTIVFWKCYKRRQRRKRKPERDTCNTAEPSLTGVPNPDSSAVPTALLLTDKQSNASGVSQGDSAIETDVMLPLESTGPCFSMMPTDCSPERSGKNQLVPSPLSPVLDLRSNN